MAYERTDISRTEQVSESIRYWDATEIREEFLGFADTVDTRANVLVETILARISETGLGDAHLVDQGCDGAATMSGVRSDRQEKVHSDAAKLGDVQMEGRRGPKRAKEAESYSIIGSWPIQTDHLPAISGLCPDGPQETLHGSN